MSWAANSTSWSVNKWPSAPAIKLDQLLDRSGAVGLLVVDEAHHVAGLAHSNDPRSQERFRRLARAAHGIERVILLSATPAANNAREFLALLHLLDPISHDLGDWQTFQDKVQHRQTIGRLLLAFVTTSIRPETHAPAP